MMDRWTEEKRGNRRRVGSERQHCWLPGKQREREDRGKEDRLVRSRERDAAWQSDGALITTEGNCSPIQPLYVNA